MRNSKTLLLLSTLILFSCVTTEKSLPSWAEVKPANNDKEIYFSYGPVDSREKAKAGLYKEISEYFGLQVSSIDKFVKNVSYINGETTVNQSKDSSVDVKSREKGLESIEIREVWSDESTNRWCILASIDTDSEKLIKKQVQQDIENERVESVIKRGEDYSKEAEQLYKSIDKKIAEIQKIQLKMEMTLQKIAEMTNYSEIINESKGAIDSSYQIDEIKKEINSLATEIKVIYGKSDLLKNDIINNKLKLIELELFIQESFAQLTKAEAATANIEILSEEILNLSDEFNKINIKAEVDLQNSEESQKSELISNIRFISSGVSQIKENNSKIEILNKDCEELLRNVKQVSYSESLNNRELRDKSLELIEIFDNKIRESRELLTGSLKLKSDMQIKYDQSVKSKYIKQEEKSDIKKDLSEVDSPITWIEIFNDKNLVLYNNAQKIVNDILVEFLIDIRVEEFAQKISEKIDSVLEVTVGEFTIEDSNISSSLSNYLRGVFNSKLIATGRISLVDYKTVTDFLDSKNENPNVIYKGSTDASSLVDNALYGTYWINNGNIELKVSINNVKTGKIVYSGSIDFPERSVPANIEVKPGNYDRILSIDTSIKGKVQKDGFEIWPDRGNGSTYRDGENMIINLVTPVTGYVKIYHISADNELTLVFPNKFDQNNKLEAGTYYRLGDSSYPFAFNLGKPYGTESLKAVFSTNQFEDLMGVNYSTEFAISGVRGINIERKINNDIKLNSLIANSYYTITE